VDNQQIVAFVVGVLSPNLIAVIQRRGWSHEVRHIVALASYLAIALFVFFFTNDVSFAGLGWKGYVSIFAPVMIGGVTAFNLIWRGTTAPKIEEATTP
jgi:hypothetical protein